MKRLLGIPAALGVIVLAAGCGGGSSDTPASVTPSTSLPRSAAKATKPIFPPSSGPAGADRVTHGPVSIAMPSTFDKQGDEVKQSKSTTVTYASSRREGKQRVAIGITWSASEHTKSAKQEAQAFRGQLLDVEHVKDLRMVRVTWPGLRDAYQFAYTDHNVSPGMQTLVLMGTTSTGQYVSVTAKAPHALADPLDVDAICGSLRTGAATDDS
ncbi:hypothetical protein GCM10011492_43280 [Flexivirga endophytica]|uniref:DUF1795 domain-containing protein n=1 Tax=Flexivirga endophytica TaxID=1849103 RepID=A0A916X0J0_9MICO|nr:hypothetical protein [Flexivirga endophytica]GGB47450.1 hypothetical protein GCM10011492_43280 [Flexivirga endophytica]GHB67057.1 hypothetical protein GCM10008112_39890 [Flexivirga endophytica]